MFTDIQFSAKDNYLYACAIDGLLYEWNTLDWARRDYPIKESKLNCLGLERAKKILTKVKQNDIEQVQKKAY